MLKKIAAGLALCALIAAVIAGPTRLRAYFFPVPEVPDDWMALLDEVRAYQRRIGFRDTANFRVTREQLSEYTICGYAPRLLLPYSYQDPAIRWGNATTEQACRAAARAEDVYFASTEAVGEIGTAMTPRMLQGKLDRFLYLVIHEDCHDQFDFPYGFEEALCNLLGYQGMAAFAREKYGARAREHRAVRAYAQTQAQLTHAVVGYYRQVEQLYARHARGEMAAAAALIERAHLFGGAERTLGWRRRTMNNVGLANEMTYSRHYPLVEAAYQTLGQDLPQTVAFFKQVDRRKPTAAAVMAEQNLGNVSSAQFVRAYETAVAHTVQRLLADHAGTAAAGRIK